MSEKRPKRTFGPGLISGASDNDPTTVATLAVVGSTTIYGLAWLVVLVIPMLIVVQAISAAVGAVARSGLETSIRKCYGNGWALVALTAVLAVNVVTLAADLEGGSAALGLLTGIPYQWFVLPFAVAVGLMLTLTRNYASVERVLRYVMLVFLAYLATAVLAHPNWHDVLRATFVPHFQASPAFVAGALAILGTTLTSYAYVWETIEVSEERPPRRRLGLVQADAGLGMVIAGISFWFIVVATGATLGVHHKTVETAQDAAAALAPLAGHFAAALFGIGLLASAIIAVPVLAGTSTYVIAEMFRWRGDLDKDFAYAPKFYTALLLSLAAGTAIAYAGVSPIKLLFWSSIAGGLGTPITLILMMLVARNRKVMQRRPIGPLLAASGWAVTAIVVSACAAFLYQTVRGGG